MSSKYQPILDKIKDFLDNSDKQTIEYANKIITDPLYKEFKANLTVSELINHKLLRSFLSKTRPFASKKAIDLLNKEINRRLSSQEDN